MSEHITPSDLERVTQELQHWRECGQECGATDGHALVLNYRDSQRENAAQRQRIIELQQALAAVENETGLQEERRQFNQRIAELERENATLQQRYAMLQDETAQCCDARKDAERQ